MRIFYYAHTGHRIGLDRFRRAAAIIKMLQPYTEITLLTSDYRIASVAREYGVCNCVGIDVVRNIANIAENGDKLIFDSEEANPIMLEDMRSFFSTFIHVNDDPSYTPAANEFVLSPYLSENDHVCNSIIVDTDYFQENQNTTPLSFFFGDDDYEKDLEKHLDFVPKEAALGMGFYYFLDYEAMLEKKFKKVFEFDAYQEMILSSSTLLSASPQAILESLASGAKPIYFQREDYPTHFQQLFQQYGVEIIQNYNKEQLQKRLTNLSSYTPSKIDNLSNKTKEILRNWLDL